MATEEEIYLEEVAGSEKNNEKFVPKSGMDFQRLTRTLVRNLYWILLLGLLGLALSYTWLRYQVPTFRVESTIGFGTEQTSSAATDILRAAGLEGQPQSLLLNNEILILKSYDIINKVVDSLGLDFSFSSEGAIRSLPITRAQLPIKFYYDSSEENIAAQNYVFTIGASGATLLNEKTKKRLAVRYKVPTALPSKDTILLNPPPKVGYIGKEYRFSTSPRSQTIARYTTALTIVPVPNSTNLLRLTVSTTVPEEAVSFVKVLIYFYDRAALDFKNQATIKGKEFLNRRIDSVGDELRQQEAMIARFQVENMVLEPSSLAGFNLGQINALDLQRAQADVQVQLVNELEKAIDRAGNPGDIVANPFGVSDPVLSGLINQYNTLVLSKRRIYETGTPEDPTLPLVNAQIDELVKAIKRNFASIRTQTSVTSRSNQRQDDEFSRRFSELPPKQQQLTDLRRQLAIKEAIYQTLLQKREDFSLQLVSTTGSDVRTIAEPRNIGQVAPDTILAYSLGGGIGIGLPILLLLGFSLLNRKLETRKEVELLSDLPIVGEINNVPSEKEAIIVKPGGRDLLAEQYRALRSNLMFMGLEDKTVGKGGRTILITSYMRDEGKSFTTLNLASILAQTGKKTIVLEFDLRKPKISSKLGKKLPVGISQYLVNPAIRMEDIMVPAHEQIPTLSLMGTGPLAPNPAELLHHPRMEELFTQLRKQFDYIVIDSAPVGLVSDTLALASYADITLYILRHKYSEKRTISEADRLQFEGKLRNVGLVINGIKASGFNQSYYYYYGGKYQYGYN